MTQTAPFSGVIFMFGLVLANVYWYHRSEHTNCTKTILITEIVKMAHNTVAAANKLFSYLITVNLQTPLASVGTNGSDLRRVLEHGLLY